MLQAMPTAIPWSGPFHVAFCRPFHSILLPFHVATQYVGTCEYKIWVLENTCRKSHAGTHQVRCTLPVLVRVQVFRLALVAGG
jgi:hypothetical protein